MNRSDVVIKIILPVLLALVSAAVAVFLSIDRRPAQLVLERVFIGPDSGSIGEYGTWHLIPLPQDTYELLLNTRPHPERVTENGFLDNCFEKEESWNTVIPAYLLCGSSSYLLNTDTPAAFANEQLFQSTKLESNSIGAAAYYPVWKFNEGLYSNPDNYINKAEISKESIEAQLPYTPDQSLKRAKIFAISEFLIQSGLTPTGPTIRIGLRNIGGKDATIYQVKGTRIFSIGGGAGSGGASLLPVNDRFNVTLDYRDDTKMGIPLPIVLEAGDTMLFEFVLMVNDSARGDGPGELLSAISLNYFNGQQNLDFFIGNFLMSDDVPEIFFP